MRTILHKKMQNKMETQTNNQVDEHLDTSETAQPSQIVEIKDSIKLTKNSKGYNYEIRLVAKENSNLLDQIEYVQNEMEKKIKFWESD